LKPLFISIFGELESGKSTLLNYLFGCYNINHMKCKKLKGINIYIMTVNIPE
jgi:GTPase Era involved in 16S rRNA processing